MRGERSPHLLIGATGFIGTNLARALRRDAEVLGTSRLIRRRAEGLYHLASEDALSINDFALNICDVFDLDESLISGRPSDPDENAARPKIGGLRAAEVTADFGIRLPTTSEGLRRMKREEAPGTRRSEPTDHTS